MIVEIGRRSGQGAPAMLYFDPRPLEIRGRGELASLLPARGSGQDGRGRVCASLSLGNGSHSRQAGNESG